MSHARTKPKQKDGAVRLNEDGSIKTYVPITREIINAAGAKYVYSYERTPLLAIQKAETVFRYREDQETNPPVNLRLLEESFGGDYMIEAFQHLLIEVGPDGKDVPYDETMARTKTRAFLDTLKGNDWNTLRECRRDFFLMAGLQDNESTRRYVRSTKNAIELKEVQVKALLIAADITKLRSESLDSMNLENLLAEFERLKKMGSLGSSPDMTQ